ncbi:PLANT THIONIN FAMILY PROTEIN [Salix purpurea]|uniref:PLANT THIONIN FAMILY PROTEIN n=1 Tax=Salix purpurea TaxID=77065 RepID=A0A9Q1A7E0_SALPP|nr:PLANT THIONIN FAMILY PROTEIN [Salix purpurea]
MTTMKKILVAVFIVSMIASHFENVASDASDCLDACTTGCVQRNTRLMQRCEIKCGIRCGPNSEVEDHTVLTVFVLDVRKEGRIRAIKSQI